MKTKLQIAWIFAIVGIVAFIGLGTYISFNLDFVENNPIAFWTLAISLFLLMTIASVVACRIESRRSDVRFILAIQAMQAEHEQDYEKANKLYDVAMSI